MPNILKPLQENSSLEIVSDCFLLKLCTALDIYGVTSVLSPGGYCFAALVCLTHLRLYRITVPFEISQIFGFAMLRASMGT